MRKTIYDILKSSFKNNKSWDYYNNSNDFGGEFPFLSKELSVRFLKNFIKVSGKAEQDLVAQIDKIGDRVTHTVSVFFIGHFIYQNTIIKNKIDTELSKLEQDSVKSCKIDFPYVWFLTCLFHDLGYEIENENILKYGNIDDLVSKSKKLNSIIGVPLNYSSNYEKYFHYRIEKNCKNDHGIVAAHLLFDSLCIIRRYSESNTKSNLCWDKGLENVYNFCAWNILAHNIWYVNEEDKCNSKSYETAGLSDLILNKKNEKIEYKIKLEENPFFFLFCLVDTLEPFKRLTNIKLLKKVSLEICNKKSTLIISTSLDCGCRENILNQALSLNNWLTESKPISDIVVINLN